VAQVDDSRFRFAPLSAPQGVRAAFAGLNNMGGTAKQASSHAGEAFLFLDCVMLTFYVMADFEQSR
jgi:hypothetical protein